MKIYKNKTKFGWHGDNGLGNRLIEKIMNGTKTATCTPIFDYTPETLKEVFKGKGKKFTVVDKNDQPHCTIEMLDVFETTFGKPDPRLLQGEGCNLKEFHEEHRRVWDKRVKENNFILDDDTRLIVEFFTYLPDED